MHQIISWFRSWFGLSEVNRWMSSLDRKLDRLQKEKQKSDRELKASKDHILRLQDKMEDSFKKQNQAIARAEGLNRRLEEALQATNDSLKTANDIVIPGLVAATQLFQQRMEAEATILQMRNVAARKDLE